MLEPGTVIRVPVVFKNGQPKFLVIVDLDSNAHCLVINSSVNVLYGNDLSRPSIIPVTIADHPFMHHDCLVDCNEVKTLSLIDIRAEINSNPNCRKGTITNGLREQIIEAMRISPFLTAEEKEQYIGSLTDNSDS